MKRLYFLFVFGGLVNLIISCGQDDSKTTNPQSQNRALLNVSNAPRFDYGLHLVDSETEQQFSVTNIGGSPATEITGNFYFSLSFNYKGGTFPGIGGTCNGTLLPHSSCTVTVVFSPKSTGSVHSSLEFNYHDGIANTSVTGPNLHGQGI